MLTNQECRNLFDDISAIFSKYLTYMAKSDKTIQQHNEALFERFLQLCDLNYISDEEFQKILIIAIVLHDIGKCSIYFQQKISDNKLKLENEINHNILSGIMFNEEEIRTLFKNDKFKKLAGYARFAVIHHHDRNNDEQLQEIIHNLSKYKQNLQNIDDNPQMYINNRTIIKYLMKQGFDNVIELTSSLQSSSDSYKKFKKYIKCLKCTGFLSKCDWSASGNYDIEYKNDFLIKCLDEFFLKSNYTKNSIQIFCYEHSNQNIVIVSPTGRGKTECGLYYIGNSKGFFALPLRTAIIAIYKRVKNIIGEEDIEKKLGLLDSDTFSEYLTNNTSQYDSELYARNTRNLSLGLNICTADQILDIALRKSSCANKLATLSYSKVVVDEIQAYSPILLAYIMFSLRMICEAGGKICILTATLPPFIKDMLKYNIPGIIFNETVDDSNEKYQQIRHKVHYEKCIMNAGYIKNNLEQFHKNDETNKVLVICNTVKVAQTLYFDLKDMYKDEDVEIHLLHSKFTKYHRSKKENHIMKVEQTEYKPSKRIIYVTTTIVEASLDIDFDILYTEMSDLCSIFQRFGRINRKGEKKLFVNCYIFLRLNNEKILLKWDKKTQRPSNFGFLDERIYEQSIHAITSNCNDQDMSEQLKKQLIDKFLTTQNLSKSTDKGSSFMYIYNETYEKLKSADIVASNFRNIDTAPVIPKHDYDANLCHSFSKQEIKNNKYLTFGIKDLVNMIAVKLKETPKNYIEIELIKNAIDNYVVSLNDYEIQQSSNISKIHVNKKSALILTILDCDYNEDCGYVKIKNI